MKALVVSSLSGPDALELKDVPDPQPGPGEVIVAVEAAGINFADTLQSRGLYPSGPKPPYIPGLEFAGVIENTQNRVMGFSGGRACAQRLTANPAQLFPIPDQWSFVEAAAFPVNYFTAYFAYELAGLLEGGKGKRVLIHAAAGGVGTAAVALGHLLGVETIGTASSDEKLARLKPLGLTHAINYKSVDYEAAVKEITQGKGVHGAFDMLGGEHTARTTRCLAPLGQIVIYGLATGSPPEFDFLAMFTRNASAHAFWLSPLLSYRERVLAAWKRLSEWIAQGSLRPIVGAELPLARSADGYRMLLERRNFGKVVLTTR